MCKASTCSDSIIVWWSGATCEDTLHLAAPSNVCRFGNGAWWESGPPWSKRAARCETKRRGRRASSRASQVTFADLQRRYVLKTRKGERIRVGGEQCA